MCLCAAVYGVMKNNKNSIRDTEHFAHDFERFASARLRQSHLDAICSRRATGANQSSASIRNGMKRFIVVVGPRRRARTLRDSNSNACRRPDHLTASERRRRRRRRFEGPSRLRERGMKFASVAAMTYSRSAVERRRNVHGPAHWTAAVQGICHPDTCPAIENNRRRRLLPDLILILT